MNSEEARFYKEYAEFKNIPLSTLMREALGEKIENEIDLRVILAYEERLKNDEVEHISFDEVIIGGSKNGQVLIFIFCIF